MPATFPRVAGGMPPCATWSRWGPRCCCCGGYPYSATVYAPDEWYNPLLPYSVMTCLVQWGAVLTVLWAAESEALSGP